MAIPQSLAYLEMASDTSALPSRVWASGAEDAAPSTLCCDWVGEGVAETLGGCAGAR
jgi:hypothetical protein